MKKSNHFKRIMQMNPEQHLPYQYVIHWNEGGIYVLNADDPPHQFLDDEVSQWAIVSSGNPHGNRLSELENQLRNEELKLFLQLMQIKFHRVVMKSLDRRDLEPDGRLIKECLLLEDINKSEAKEIAYLHKQDFFVYLRRENRLKVSVLRCAKLSPAQHKFTLNS